LAAADGDVISYLNAGDFYSPWALDVVIDVLEKHDLQWLTGLAVSYNARGQLTRARVPIRYRRRFVRKGAYGSRLLPWFLQQESTFWRRSLMDRVDLSYLRSFRLAGDSYLWKCLGQVAEPAVVESYLGGFSHHDGQLSSDMNAYRREQASIQSRLNLADLAIGTFDRLEQYAPPRIRKILNPSGFLRYSYTSGCWG